MPTAHREIRFGDSLLHLGDTVRVRPGGAFAGETGLVVEIRRSRPLSRSLITLDIGPIRTVFSLERLERA